MKKYSFPQNTKKQNRVSSSNEISVSTIREEVRIKLTKQLIEFRDAFDGNKDNLKPEDNQLIFSNTLTNVERKFLHKLAEDMGLNSKSCGGGTNRFITVTRKISKKDNSKKKLRMEDFIEYQLGFHSHKLLSHLPATDANVSSVTSSSISPETKRAFQSMKIHSKLPIDREYLRKIHEESKRKFRESPNFETIQRTRSKLPAFELQKVVCELVKKNQIVLVTGETGCGKTTQVPQFLLDDIDIGPTCRILVTQPRRISAITVAERIAYERNETIGATIGYNIRLESEYSNSTQILFVTPGLLLRKLQNDPLLEEFTHIIVDEAHERDRFTEFLFIILKDICERRPSLKLILMSATLATGKLSAYFGGVPNISMGGSLFPVVDYYLEDVLRFTEYFGEEDVTKVASLPVSTVGNKVVSAESAIISSYSEALALYKTIHRSFTCSLCGDSSFKSAEELGTHVVFCDGVPVMPKKTHSDNLFRNPNDMINQLSKMVQAPITLQLDSSESINTKLNIEDSQSPSEDDFNVNSSEFEVEGEGEDENLSLLMSDLVITPKPPILEDEVDALVRKYQYMFDDNDVDHELILKLLKYIFASSFGQEGSVLIFLPGWDDISTLFRIIQSDPYFTTNPRFTTLQLHSGVSRKDQDLVFSQIIPGHQKIILSTNIAETSITIDGVTVVIDSGKVKEKTYDPHIKLSYLKTSWVSKSSARQRKGRAGRTKSGVVFRLYSKRRFASFPDFQDSELLRMPLDELVLQTIELGLAPGRGDDNDSASAFLMKALDPPHPLSIFNAVSLLKTLGCIDANEDLTLLGEMLAKLPIEPRIGRLIVIGCLFGCSTSAIMMAAAMGFRDPYLIPSNDQQRFCVADVKKRFSQGYPSDQIAVLNVMYEFNRNQNFRFAEQFCNENMLSKQTMTFLRELVKQMNNSIADININLSDDKFLQRNNSNIYLLLVLVSISLYPDYGIRRIDGTVFHLEKGRKGKIHPASVNAKSNNYKFPSKKEFDAVVFQDLVASTSTTNNSSGTASLLMMLNTSACSLCTLLIICGKLELIDKPEDDMLDPDEDSLDCIEGPSYSVEYIYVSIDDWLLVSMREQEFKEIMAARKIFQMAMDCFASNPNKPLTKDLLTQLDIVIQVLVEEQAACAPREEAHRSTPSQQRNNGKTKFNKKFK